MVATDEIMLETEAGGKSARRRGTSAASAAEVYSGAPWMVDPVLPPVSISRVCELLPGCRRGEDRFLFVDRCTLLTDVGMTLDPVTGLYYSRNRNYSPSLGAWISQDPQHYVNGANTYQFVMGNPVGRIDPQGTACKDSQPLYPLPPGTSLPSSQSANSSLVNFNETYSPANNGSGGGSGSFSVNFASLLNAIYSNSNPATGLGSVGLGVTLGNLSGGVNYNSVTSVTTGTGSISLPGGNSVNGSVSSSGNTTVGGTFNSSNIFSGLNLSLTANVSYSSLSNGQQNFGGGANFTAVYTINANSSIFAIGNGAYGSQSGVTGGGGIGYRGSFLGGTIQAQAGWFPPPSASNAPPEVAGITYKFKF